jgi:hypothetical protein
MAADLPDYLKHWPGLYVRRGDRIVEAPEEDAAVARMYPAWPDKGPVTGGKRLTILMRTARYRVGEDVHVIHVVEVAEEGHEVFVMGPKDVYGEYLDGELVTRPVPDWEDPLIPPFYDGAVEPSPAVDYNYEITSYRFAEPGVHEIVWVLGALRSNKITFEIVEE